MRDVPVTVMFSLLSIGSASLALDNWDGAVSVALNLVASAIAFCAGLAFRSLYERVARKREAEAQRRLIQTGASAWTFPWLESYYLKRGSVDDMYVAKLADGRFALQLGTDRPTETVIIDGLDPQWVTVMRYADYAWREVPELAPWWQFATFTLNLVIDYTHAPAFSHAWSLCVEEHFYALFPILAMARTRRPAA